MCQLDAIVALEFTGLGSEYSFDRLLGHTKGVRFDPLDALTEHPLSLSEQAVRLLAQLRVTPRVVLGHCTAARLAVQLAELVAARRPPPVVVLFDPDPIFPAYLSEEFARISHALAGQRLAPPVPLGSGHEQLLAMETKLAELARGLQTAYGDDEAATELAGEILARYAAWLRFLSAGSSAAPVEFSGQVIVISSEPAPPAVDSIVRSTWISYVPGCGSAGVGLLSSPSARQAVQEIIEVGGAHRERQ